VAKNPKMNKAVEKYLAYLLARGYSLSLRETLVYSLEKLTLYLREAFGIEHWREVETKHLDSFALYMRRDYKTKKLKNLKESTVNNILSRVRSFFEWQSKNGLLLINPAEDIRPIRVIETLPKIISEQEMTRLIEMPDLEKSIGIRDRAIMETLYATGIRHRELHRLNLYDLDLRSRRLTVIQGKNRRDRIVPLTENAVFWLNEYLNKSRSELIRKAYSKKAKQRGEPMPPPTQALWLSNIGKRLSYSSIDQNISKYARLAEIETIKVNVHSFRHCCASHLLANGADIRHIQKLLGHRNLEATQIYLHLQVEDLRKATEKLKK
jgi:integrase/recombinase XerD